MKIIVSESVTALSHDVFGNKVIKDVKALYGGTVAGRGKHFKSPDEAVVAAVNKRETLVTVHGLGLQPNAARWTAINSTSSHGSCTRTRLLIP